MAKQSKYGASRALVRRETTAAYLFLLPSLIFFLGFVVYPMVTCFINSFTQYNVSGHTFSVSTMFDNYIRMFNDKVFWRGLWNTILIVVVSVPVVTAFSLWVGAAIYRMGAKTRSFFRCIFYLPVVTGTVAVAVVWKWMFNKYTGLFNYILGTDIGWLGDERFAIWCIILILFTTSIGQPIVLYVAALGNVDTSMIEAAEVDGATELQVFWKIKWPQIMPTTLYILVITTINSFQCFALIQMLTSGGPNNSTQTIMYYIYYQAIRLGEYGYGMAMGIVLAIIISLFSAIQFKVAGKSNS